MRRGKNEIQTGFNLMSNEVEYLLFFHKRNDLEVAMPMMFHIKRNGQELKTKFPVWNSIIELVMNISEATFWSNYIHYEYTN